MPLTIIRGLPGSGKSTLARKLAEERHAILIEPDELMYENKVYQYTPFKFGLAHIACLNVIKQIFWANRNVHVVFADVLPTRDEVNVFLFQCPFRRDEVNIIDMPKITFEEAKARNVHNVCEEDLKRMFEEWEDWE